MSEVTKLYENAGIDYEERYNNCTLNKEGECELKCSCDICKYSEEKYIYPPFTAEKVICLLEWEANRGIIDIKHSQKGYQLFTYIHTGNYGKSIIDAVASYFCVKWQDLTSEEKQQIKEILE